MSTNCCYVLMIHLRTKREQVSNDRVEESSQGKENAPTRETRGHTQVTCIKTCEHPWRTTTTMPTSFSLNKDLQSSWFMRETIQQTLMTKQRGPTEWPPDVQEVWDRLNAETLLTKLLIKRAGSLEARIRRKRRRQQRERYICQLC